MSHEKALKKCISLNANAKVQYFFKLPKLFEIFLFLALKNIFVLDKCQCKPLRKETASIRFLPFGCRDKTSSKVSEHAT